MEPRPDEIAAHRFSLKLFGVHPGEVRRSLLEIGAALDRTRTALTLEILECTALEKSLEAVTRRVQELQEQLIATQAKIGPIKVESVSSHAGSGPTDELKGRVAEAERARADEIVAAAQQLATTIMQTARAAALDTLRSARAAAETAIHLADLGVMARRAGPRADGDRPQSHTRQTTAQHLSALITLFEALALELKGALSYREALRTDDGGGAGTATCPARPTMPFVHLDPDFQFDQLLMTWGMHRMP